VGGQPRTCWPTASPALQTSRDMKKDSSWTKETNARPTTNDDITDKENTIDTHDKNFLTKTNKDNRFRCEKDLKTTEPDENAELFDSSIEEGKNRHNDKKKVQMKKTAKFHSRHQIEIESDKYTQGNVTIKVRCFGDEKITRKLNIHSTRNPDTRNIICTGISQAKISRTPHFKYLCLFLLALPAVRTFTIGDPRLDTSKNALVIDKDNDQKTTMTQNRTSTTSCICPTSRNTTIEAQTATSQTPTETTGSNFGCVCPDVLESLAEKETATDMPTATGRRRQRREIEELDLFVDEFDEKILKKMPFLKFY